MATAGLVRAWPVTRLGDMHIGILQFGSCNPLLILFFARHQPCPRRVSVHRREASCVNGHWTLDTGQQHESRQRNASYLLVSRIASLRLFLIDQSLSNGVRHVMAMAGRDFDPSDKGGPFERRPDTVPLPLGRAKVRRTRNRRTAGSVANLPKVRLACLAGEIQVLSPSYL